MRHIWEPSDIKSGVKYTKRGLKEIHLIGYTYRDVVDPLSHYKNEQVLVTISLSDGLVSSPYKREELCEMLNVNEYIPLEIRDLMEKR